MTEEKKHPVTEQLDKYQKEGANMLIPSTGMDGLSDMHKPIVEQIWLNPDPINGSDVYTQYGKDNELLLTGHAIEKIAVCASVEWIIEKTKKTEEIRNKGGWLIYIAFQAVGGIRKIDGSLTPMGGNYDIDFLTLQEDLEERYSKKAAETYKGKTKSKQEQKDYVEFCIKRDIRQKRSHALSLCETGAKNRVLRKLLCLKNHYKPEELKKPFVMVRVCFSPNFNDPAVKKQFIDAGIKSITGVYGSSPTNEPAQLLPTEEVHDIPEKDIKEQEDFKPDPVEDFALADPKSQVRMLEALIKKKGYITKGTPLENKEIEDLTEERKIDLFDHLNTLKDDDLPW